MQRIVPLLLALVIGLALAASCLFVVDQRQYGVVFAFGRIERIIDRPGLHYKLPPPFQNIQYLDKRVLTIDNPDVDRFVTSEKINVLVDSFVKWRIVEPRTFLTAVGGNELIATDRLQRNLRDALQNEIARRTVADVVSGQRDKIMAEVRSKLFEDAKRLGAEIVDVRLKRVDFAPEVQERVFDRMQSERKRVANERRATGSGEAEKIRADAERQREVILAEAYRDAQQIRGEGDAKATTLYAEAFGQNPEFAGFYRSLEAYRASFRNRTDLLVVDPSADFFRYFRSPGGNVPRPQGK